MTESSRVASPQHLTGKITYMHDDASGSAQTWTACADLTGAKQLTSVAMRQSGWPVWSPDGSRIAFDSDRADPNVNDGITINDVFTMKSDGTDVRKLTDSTGESGDPAYSPDGKLIAFEMDRADAGIKQGIFVMNAADGSGLRRITSVPGSARDDHSPRFAPDGKRVVFLREIDDDTSNLFVVDLDGSGLRQITPGDLHPGDAAWSPDGTQIVFEADLVADGRAGPWIVGADGSGLRSLTGPQDVSATWDGFSDPVWSPDGSLILTMHGLHDPDGSARAGLATIHPDGTDLRYIADGLGAEHQADWTAAVTC